MKKVILLSLLAFCIVLAGCSKDAEINSFIKEFEGTTQEVTKKIESGDVDGAVKAFADKKASLKASWDAIKGARGFQVSEDSKKKLMDSVQTNMTALTKAVISKSISDRGNADKLKGLLDEYKNVFKM